MEHNHGNSICCETDKKRDYFFIIASSIFIFSYFIWLFGNQNLDIKPAHDFTKAVFDIANQVWWGVLTGAIFVGILSKVPQQKIFKLIGKPGSVSGIIRAVLAGLLLDLCSHGLLLVAMQIYRKGASFGQVAAFLLSSPWNSFSLTLILISLIGIKLTFLFIILSMVIGVITGIIIDKFFPDERGLEIPEDNEPVKWLSLGNVKEIAVNGIRDSKPIVKWLLFGIIVTALLRTFVSTEHFAHFFGPTIAGLTLTLVFATILEVCSEGSTPIAADILLRAHAVGNGFAFLMAGVATDYTEIMAIKETTKSWKIAFLIPLISLPQIILISIILNNSGYLSL